MKIQDTYFSVIKNTKLPPAALFFNNAGDQNEDEFTIGGILKDTKLAWLANRSRFHVIDLNTGLKIAAWNFGAVLSDFQVQVRWAAEVPTPLIEDTKQLVIGLQCEVIGGMICLFHCNGSRVLRCIKVNCLVSHLVAFDSIPDGPLDCFDGVIVVGTESGLLLAVDMSREKCIQAIEDSYQGNAARIYDELNMAEIAVLPMENIALIREKISTLEEKQHLAVQFNERSFQKNQFLLHNPNETVRLRAAREKVVVTTMLYIPQLGSVVVGFNFGAFQMWNLLTMTLEYTSPVNVECLSVTELGFQEPSDDPRAFCYLWVVYSTNVRYEEGFPLAVLYSLSYDKKLYLSDTLYLYEGLLNCNLRYQVELTCSEGSTPIKNLIGGRSIKCHSYSISTNKNTNNTGEDSVLNICQLVWECWTGSPNTPITYVMLLFDLDQWYKDQMPGVSEVENNTFLSVVNLSEAALVLGRLCDARIDCATISPYQATVQRLEEHFYPNSLGYECVCLSGEESARLSTVGVQRQLVCTLSGAAPSLLLTPTKFYQQCLAVGLVPLYAENMLSDPTIGSQRCVVLSLALEAGLVRLLVCCVSEWAAGSHSGAGCTLHAALDWAWRRAQTLKAALRTITAPLFYTPAQQLDAHATRSLQHAVKQLNSIATLLQTIGDKCSHLIIPDVVHDIKERHKAVAMVALYFRAVEWFLNVGLLPQLADQDAEQLNRLPYPLDALIPFYQNRRFNLHRLNGDTRPSEELENKSCPLLYIDQLIDTECGGSSLRSIWLSLHSVTEGVYPPPSLQSLLKVYQLPDLKEEFKHCLVLYMLVDYSSVYAEPKYEATIRKLMQFPAIFGLSNSSVKATEAFWNLDHQNFDFALDQLQCLTDKSLPQWQHSVVLSALHSQNKSQAALQYIHMQKPAPSVTESGRPLNTISTLDRNWRTCYSLYLNRGLVFEAFSVVRDAIRTMEPRTQYKMFSYFFKSCKELNLLSKLLHLSMFSTMEEEIFVKFLQDARDKQCDDILVMFYLEKSRYIEAQNFNNALRPPTATDRLRYNGTRDILVDLSCNTLPHITQQLADCIRTHRPHEVDVRMVVPTPMSVRVQDRGATKQTYKSTFIEETIGKASEIWRRNGLPRSAQKRKMVVEETPFVCTPKAARRDRSHISVDSNSGSDHNQCTSPPSAPKSPPTNANLTSVDLVTPKTALSEYDRSRAVTSEKLARDIATFLDIPSAERKESQDQERDGRYSLGAREATPHSILKSRRASRSEMGASPADSQYLNMSEDEELALDTELERQERTSQHSDASKCLRFTIPNSASTSPSPARTEPHYSVLKDVVSQLHFSLTDDSLQLSEDGDGNDSKSPVLSARRRTDDTVSRDRTSGEGVARRSTSLSASPISQATSPAAGLFRSSDSYSDIICDTFRESPLRRSNTVTPERAAVEVSEDEHMEVTADVPVPAAPAVCERSEVSSPLLLAPAPAVRRSIRSGSRTPEPAQAVEEVLPARRNLRSRSRTPEIEITPAPSERVLRSPRRFQSTVEKSHKKKPLSRLILEQNTFSKSKVTETIVLDESHVLETSELRSPNLSSFSDFDSATPSSTCVVPDWKFSPINDKSVLMDASQSILTTSASPSDISTTSVCQISRYNVSKLKFSPIEDKSVLQEADSIIIGVSPSTSTLEERSLMEEHQNMSYATTSILKDFSSSFAKSASENTTSDNKKMSGNLDDVAESVEKAETTEESDENFQQQKDGMEENEEMAELENDTMEEVSSEYTQSETQQSTQSQENPQVQIVREETQTRVIDTDPEEENSKRISDSTKAQIQNMLGRESKFAQEESKASPASNDDDDSRGGRTQSEISSEANTCDSSADTEEGCGKMADDDVISLESSDGEEKPTEGASAFIPETDIANLEQSHAVRRERSFLSGDKMLASTAESPKSSPQKSTTNLTPDKSADASPQKSPSTSPASVMTKAGKKSFEDIYSERAGEVSLLESDDSNIELDIEMQLQYRDDDEENSVEESDSGEAVTTSEDNQESGDTRESSDVVGSGDTIGSSDTLHSATTLESGDASVEDKFQGTVNPEDKDPRMEAVKEPREVREKEECVESQEVEDIEEMEANITEDETLNRAIIDIDDVTLEVQDVTETPPSTAVTTSKLSPILKPMSSRGEYHDLTEVQEVDETKTEDEAIKLKCQGEQLQLKCDTSQDKKKAAKVKSRELRSISESSDSLKLVIAEADSAPNRTSACKITRSRSVSVDREKKKLIMEKNVEIQEDISTQEVEGNHGTEGETFHNDIDEGTLEDVLEVDEVKISEDEKMQMKAAEVTSRKLRSISESSDSLNLIIAEQKSTPAKPVSTRSTRSRSVSVDKDSTSTLETLPAKRVTRLRSREKSSEKDKPDEEESHKDQPIGRTRRSSRTLSSEEDNASVASDESNGTKTKRVRKTKAKTESSDTQVRKRISKLTKPDLSVIPEMSIEESSSSASMLGNSEFDSYSTSRRLTRHQQSMLSHSREIAARVGRNARASRTPSADSMPDDDDADDQRTSRSVLSEDKEQITPGRVRRGPSLETGSIRDLRNRRLSVDSVKSTGTETPKKASRRSSVVEASPTPERVASPLLSESGAESAGRPRRRSFHKAVEALSTPKKGRRGSTDSRSERGDTPEQMNSAESSPTNAGSPGESSPRSKRSRQSSRLLDSPKPQPRSTRKTSQQ